MRHQQFDQIMNMQEDLVLTRRLTVKQEKHKRVVSDLERDVFEELKLNYSVHDIPIEIDQELHTIFVPCSDSKVKDKETFIFGHGFGGSSLMFFSVISHLLTKGNLIFMELRGMGLNIKPDTIKEDNIEIIEEYFLKGLKFTLTFYKIVNATFICHSFSAYLVLLFTTRYPDLTKRHIKQLVMLSPVGLTPKEEDYKREITSCGDILHTIIHKLGWTFNLTYKSPLRTVCSCCKKRLIMNSLEEQNLEPHEKEMVYSIMQVLIMLPDGSESLFYNFFLPRVLPIVPLEPLFLTAPQIPIILVYGGENDWVDRTGAQKMAKRFPEMVSLVEIPGITHNIALHTIQCKELFQQLFR